MKTRSIFAAFAAAFALAATLCSCNSKTQETAETPATALEYMESLGLGWNLGNCLDAHNEGVATESYWHLDHGGLQIATQATFDSVKAAGFSSVRIPVTWMGHIGEAPEYKIDSTWMARVTEVAGYAKKAGLKAIVNIHHDGGAANQPGKENHHWLTINKAVEDSTVNKAIKDKLYAMWNQIATNFKEEGDWLMFETMNEIHDGNWGNGANTKDDGASYRVLNEWNQTCVDAIRAAGGENEKRYIGIPGYVCNPDLTIQNLVIPNDKVEGHILIAVHSYDPWDYAGSGLHSEWGHTGKDIVEGTSEKTYTDMLDRLYEKYVKAGIPVYFGEFGCVHRADDHAEGFRKYYLEYVVKAFREHHMTGFFWDNGYDMEGDDAFGLIRHDNGAWIANGQEIVKIMVDAFNNDDKDYTLESIYNRAPEAK